MTAFYRTASVAAIFDVRDPDVDGRPSGLGFPGFRPVLHILYTSRMGWKCHNPQCTAVLPDSARFCRRCGRKRPAPAPTQADTAHATTVYAGTGFPLETQSPGVLYEPPGDNRPPIVLWTILLVVLFIVIGALMAM